MLKIYGQSAGKILILIYAAIAELVYAMDLKSIDGNIIRVRISLAAPLGPLAQLVRASGS